MNTSIAIDKSYICYVWGSGKHGKLGLNSDDKNYTQPRKLFTMFKEEITEFAPGPFHTLALTNSGKIFAFGNSKDGKLGIAQDQLAFVGT
jgi:alpha-tubulin suppressor-like RCC1 family protein